MCSEDFEIVRNFLSQLQSLRRFRDKKFPYLKDKAYSKFSNSFHCLLMPPSIDILLPMSFILIQTHFIIASLKPTPDPICNILSSVSNKACASFRWWKISLKDEKATQYKIWSHKCCNK